jgi:ribonuclease Z
VVNFPDPKNTLADIEDQAARNVEYDSKLYYPPDVYRKPNPVFPNGFEIDVNRMIGEKIAAKVKSKFEDARESAQLTADELRAGINTLRGRLKKKLGGK